MPILRAITRTQRNATPLRCLETGFPGPGRIGLFFFFFFFEETFTFSLEEATSISSTKNYLYVTFRDARTLLLYIVCAGFAPCEKTAYN